MTELPNKVYLLKGWNREIYEDSFEWIDSIYYDIEKALKELKNKSTRYKENEYKIIEMEIIL